MDTLTARPDPALGIDTQLVNQAAFDRWPIAWERVAQMFPTLDAGIKLYRAMMRFVNPSANVSSKYDILMHRQFGESLRYAADLAVIVDTVKADTKFAYLLSLYYFEQEVSCWSSLFPNKTQPLTSDEEWRELWALLKPVKIPYLREALESIGGTHTGELHRNSPGFVRALAEMVQSDTSVVWVSALRRDASVKDVLLYVKAEMPFKWFGEYLWLTRKADPMPGRSLASLYKAGVPMDYIATLWAAGMKPAGIRDGWKRNMPLDYMLAMC